MDCKCFEEIKKGIAEDPTTPKAVIQMPILNLRFGTKLVERPFMRYTHERIKKDGSPTKRRKSALFGFKFCPWCVERYPYNTISEE